MATLKSLGIMLAACVIGLPIFILLTHIMGIAGSPGAFVHAAGERKRNSPIMHLGLALTTIGQSYIVGAYAYIVVVMVRWFSLAKPDLPAWPLWLAAFFHAMCTPIEAMERKPERINAQHRTLVVTCFIGFCIFFIAIFKPTLLSVLFGWIPKFHLLQRS